MKELTWDTIVFIHTHPLKNKKGCKKILRLPKFWLKQQIAIYMMYSFSSGKWRHYLKNQLSHSYNTVYTINFKKFFFFIKLSRNKKEKNCGFKFNLLRVNLKQSITGGQFLPIKKNWKKGSNSPQKINFSFSVKKTTFFRPLFLQSTPFFRPFFLQSTPFFRPFFKVHKFAGLFPFNLPDLCLFTTCRQGLKIVFMCVKNNHLKLFVEKKFLRFLYGR